MVDDNHDCALSLAMLLKLMGHETQVAEDGLAAVPLAESFRPDVILLDTGMPKLSGYEVCRRIRNELWGKDVFMIACTGWGQEDDRRLSQEAGFDTHVVKPVDPLALAKLLAQSAATLAAS